MRKKYAKYNDDIKEIIIRTGNTNAFPELNIPRTTALYWIKNSKKKTKLRDSSSAVMRKYIKRTQHIISIEKIKNSFLNNACNIYKGKYSKTKENTELINLIDSYKNSISVNTLCRLIFFNQKVYYSNRSRKQQVPYIQVKSNQLTVNEQKILISISQNKKLKHLSIKQLQLLAFRRNLLHCHYDTWRKYINKYHPERKQERLLYKRKNESYKYQLPIIYGTLM